MRVINPNILSLVFAVAAPATIAVPLLSAREATAAPAHEHPAGGLSFRGGWARESAAGQAVSGGYLTIVNAGGADRLIDVSSPIATQVQLHEMVKNGDVMGMRRIATGIPVPANSILAFKPGGLHLMFMGLKRQLRRGERFPVQLNFQRQGRVTVRFVVQAAGSTAFDGAGEGAGHEGH